MKHPYGLMTIMLLVLFVQCQSSPGTTAKIITGAEQPGQYLSLLEGKRVGLVANHTAIKDTMHLLDFLIQQKVNVVMVFAPEHGFRGEASAGETIADGKDRLTGVPVFSLYGKNNKPAPEQLSKLDVVVFDIQDVGCRFYTYLSTLYLVMEACAENKVPLLVFDRPNPNGDYVAGPMLKEGFTSFVGMVPVPVVHGCTMGEMAEMINGEKWIKTESPCSLKVIRVRNYTHKTRYEPPVAPSPNLPNYLSVRLYPSLCFFEATSVSIGRGTPFPFQVIGGTQPDEGSFRFIPEEIPGVALNPVNKGKTCYGTDLRTVHPVPAFTLRYFLDFYKKYPVESDFLTSERWLNLLSGSDHLLKMIREGKQEKEIISAWAPDLERYKEIRKKYLFYPDFE